MKLKAVATMTLPFAQTLGRMIINIILALLLLVLGLCLAYRGVNFLYSMRYPPKEIVLVPFEGDEEGKKLIGDLPAKLRQLQNWIASSPAYGYFQLPSIALASIQGTPPASTTKNILETVDLKIYDVKAWAVIDALNSFLAPVRYELRGSVSHNSNQWIITSQLVRGDSPERSWIVGPTKDNAKEVQPEQSPTERSPTNKAPTLNDPFDDLLYQIVFNLAEKPPPGFKSRQTSDQTYHFTNWQSLRDFVRGMHSLRDYQDNLNREDLNDALAFFSDFAIQAPNDPYALYFLGVVLAGIRQDIEAITVFQEVRQVLESKAGQEKWKDMLRESKLNEAVVTLKVNTRAWVANAKSMFEDIIKELTGKKELSEAIKAESELVETLEKENYKAQIASEEALKAANERVRADLPAFKLLARANAHLAQSHGAMLAFLRNGAAAEFQEHREAIKTNLPLADRMLAAMEGWEARQNASASERDSWDRDNRILEMRIENARGYCTYQEAVLRPDDENNEFLEDCSKAILCLLKANRANPNYYVVLQNLGTIYADPRFDPKGEFLQLAENLFTRTKILVPNDYYQYEVLALIHRRRAQMLRVPELITEEVTNGHNNALEAKRHRPQTHIALIELARLSRINWEATGKNTPDEGTKALKFFQDASAEFREHQDFLEEYLSFVKDLAHANYPADELDQHLGELANNSGLDEDTQERLTRLRLNVLHVAKDSWKANGKTNDNQIKTIMKVFRLAASNLHNQEYFKDYLSLICELVHARAKDAAGLTELDEHLAYLQQTLALPENKQIPQEVLNEAQRLHKELEDLQKNIPH